MRQAENGSCRLLGGGVAEEGSGPPHTAHPHLTCCTRCIRLTSATRPGITMSEHDVIPGSTQAFFSLGSSLQLRNTAASLPMAQTLEADMRRLEASLLEATTESEATQRRCAEVQALAQETCWPLGCHFLSSLEWRAGRRQGNGVHCRMTAANTDRGRAVANVALSCKWAPALPNLCLRRIHQNLTNTIRKPMVNIFFVFGLGWGCEGTAVA